MGYAIVHTTYTKLPTVYAICVTREAAEGLKAELDRTVEDRDFESYEIQEAEMVL